MPSRPAPALPDPPGRNGQARTFAEQQADAATWLATNARRGGKVWSYSLKHRVQHDVGAYVSGSAVVAAALAAGYRIVGQVTREGDAWLALTVRRRRARAGR